MTILLSTAKHLRSREGLPSPFRTKQSYAKKHVGCYISTLSAVALSKKGGGSLTVADITVSDVLT